MGSSGSLDLKQPCCRRSMSIDSLAVAQNYCALVAKILARHRVGGGLSEASLDLELNGLGIRFSLVLVVAGEAKPGML